MSQKITEKQLSQNQQNAAQLVAEGGYHDAEIAEQVGVVRETIVRWKKQSEFQDEVARRRAEVEERIMSEGAARKAIRVQRYLDRLARMDAVIAARAEAYGGEVINLDGEPDEVAGGSSGLLVRQVKSIGVGKANMRVEEYVVDTGLLREIRELEKQVAQELGQWTEQHDLTSGGEAIPITTVVIEKPEGVDE